MDEMFYDCINLTYIDLSNFDMQKCENFNNMFSNVDNIKFINLYNFKNDRTFNKIFEKVNNIFVCQKEKIITNPRAYNCCDYNFETDECEIIPTTIVTTIPTTIPNFQTTDFIEPSDTNERFSSNIITTYPNIFKMTSFTSDVYDEIEQSSSTHNLESTELLHEKETDIKSTIYEEINEPKSSFFENIENIPTTNPEIGIESTNNKIIESTNFEIDTKDLKPSSIDNTNSITSKYETTESSSLYSEKMENISTKASTIELINSENNSNEPNTESTISSKVGPMESTTSNLYNTEKNSEINANVYSTSQIEYTELSTSKYGSMESTSSKVDTKEPFTSENDYSKPTDSDINIKEPSTFKIERKTSKIISTEPSTSSKVDTIEPSTLKLDKIGTITSKIDIIEQTTSEIYKTEHISSKTVSTNHISTTPYNIYSTSLIDNTNTSTPIKETTKNIFTTSINENKESTTIINESINKIASTINDNKEYSTSIIKNTINQITQIVIPNSTIIETKDNIIQTTEVINYSTFYSLVVIGYSNFANLVTKIIFNIYFTSLNGPFYSRRLRFPVEITSNRILRTLEAYEAICEAKEEEAKEKISYSCEIEVQIENIANVKIIDEFNFSSINATISFSPLAENYKDKIQAVEKVFDNLINSTIYILENSKIGQYKNQYFNISGVINEPKSKFQKIDINLMVFTNDENITKETQLNCTIIEIIEKNYTINCKRNSENNNYNLQNAISIYEDEILVINFNNRTNSSITFENENKYRRYYFNNKKENLSSGGIVAIILVMIAVIISLIFSFTFLRRNETNRVKRSNQSESSLMKLAN